MATKEKPIRPDLKQMKALRDRHPKVMFVFRLGERCAMYWDDAREAERIVGIGRRGSVLYFPAADLERHLRTLIQSGRKVAVGDPIEK